MVPEEALTFDQILKKSDDDGQVLFSLAIILAVGALRAALTAPFDAPDDWFGWSWKVALFFGILLPWVPHLWKTAKLGGKAYREASAFLLEGLRGPAVREMPFGQLERLVEIVWLEHQAFQRLEKAQRTAAAAGRRVILLVEAPGETLLEHTRISCAGCGRPFPSRLPADLLAARAAGRKPVPDPDLLDAAGRCPACGSATGRFRTGLADPED